MKTIYRMVTWCFLPILLILLFAKQVSATEGNLLVNSDFESYTGTNGIANGWEIENWQANASSFEVQAIPEGSGIQKVSGSGIGANGYVSVNQTVLMEANKPYTVRSQIKVESLSNAKVQMYVDFIGSTGVIGVNVTDQLVSTRGYLTLTNSGETPAGTIAAKVYLLIRSTGAGGAGVVYVDSLQLEYGHSSNQLLNPYFKKYTGTNGIANGWEIENWQANASSFEVQATQGGSRIQKISGSGIGANGYVSVNQTVLMEANKPYTVRSQIKVESLSNAKVQMYVDFIGSTGVIGVNVTDQLVPTRGYLTLTNSGETPAGTIAAKVYLLIRSTGAEGAGVVYVDSLQLEYGHSSNLLINPYFKNYTGNNGIANGWEIENWQANASSFDVQATPEGSGIQKVSGSGIGANGYVSVNQTVLMEANKPYTVRSQIKVESLSNAKVQMYVDFIGSTGVIGVNVTDQLAPTGGYLTLTNSGETPAGTIAAKVYLLIRSTGAEGAGVLYINSAQLEYGALKSLLFNSSFEEPFIEGSGAWSLFQDPNDSMKLISSAEDDQVGRTRYHYDRSGRLLTSRLLNQNMIQHVGYKYDANGNIQKKIVIPGTLVSNPVYDGKKSLLVSAWWIKNMDFKGIAQNVKIEPNKLLKFQAAINIESLHHTKVQLYIDFYNINGQIIDTAMTELTQTTGGNYSVLASEKMTPSDASFARVYILLRAVQEDGAGIIYVDDVRLTYQ
ncbi:hypothetical protein [Paenibacillus puerhi]|uniref:hypothetical protein n=1 Tax=Paenibacillus puerhi TaxID=2692622 RepID=UPI00135C302D|nr:hypothetical protein [Paenibacillus puerhi]